MTAADRIAALKKEARRLDDERRRLETTARRSSELLAWAERLRGQARIYLSVGHNGTETWEIESDIAQMFADALVSVAERALEVTR